MCFPYIEFVKKSGSYDFISDFINLAGNGAVVAAAGISLAVIGNIALKALGFNALATSIATAIPVTVGAIGAGVAVIAGVFALYILFEGVRAAMSL
jgi:hypothetical protein